MGKRFTTEEFIERARAVHGDKYGYDDVVYVNSRTPVKIVCKEHGVFKQFPIVHTSNHGCPKCAGNITKSSEQCITDFKNVHGDRYDYSNVKYVNTHKIVKIGCKYHGFFEQTPHAHIQGQGCPKCGIISRVNSQTKSIKQCIVDFKNVHGDRYDYSNVEYVNRYTKVRIGCKEHGVFEQRPSDHIFGYGCPKCNLRCGYSKMTPTELQAISPAYVYIVRLLSDDGEVFDKIGVTKNPPYKRFKKFAHYIPIGAECREFENMEVALNKEAELHCEFNPVHYTPKHYFGGSINECFEPLPFKFNLEDSKKWLSGEME